MYADANKISDEQFAEEYRITEWIEDGDKGILEAQVNIPNGNYDSVLQILRAKDYIIDIEPVIGDSVLTNTSRLFYVMLHSAQEYALLNSTAQRLGAEIRRELDFCDNWYELNVNKNSFGNSVEVANMFWETGYFASIDPGFILKFKTTSSSACVTDSRFNEQWGMQAIKTCSAWKITKGDTNVRIAVIDKGVDESHREFDSTHIVFSFDMNDNLISANSYCEVNPNRDNPHDSDTSICFHHGTHVGGIIFANHNRDSVAGICPGLINISYSFKLCEDSGVSKLAKAINLSVDYGAKIINNSWACPNAQHNQTYAPILERAIDTALFHDCVIVFASGNNAAVGYPDSSVIYPACYKPELVVVGAVDSSFVRQICSGFGFRLDLVAPGVDILSTHNNNGYYSTQGTSMAAPHVSGVVGLMLSINSGLTGQDVRDIIEQTVQKNLNLLLSAKNEKIFFRGSNPLCISITDPGW